RFVGQRFLSRSGRRTSDAMSDGQLTTDTHMASAFFENVNGPIAVPLFSRSGEQVGTVDVDPNDFGGKISPRLMHEAVLMYEASQRAGTHSTLRRGQVAGSTKKLFRQKGTGNARVGTRRTNKRRG